jgi:Pyruvate/2-oxoacid:ferredoxin oxidoreductase delta subunit
MTTRRRIIRIDETKCDGCGLCVSACAEGAIALVDGKARLVSETYCDGLGACLGECPQGALTMEERAAPAFDAAAVAARQGAPAEPAHHAGCPGSAMRSFTPAAPHAESTAAPPPSQLGHWPVQLTLVPPAAPFLRGADLLVCADCVPFAVPDFHSRYLAGRAVVVGCPKLDDLDAYREKLAEIMAVARPRRLTVLRMEVPCCGGIAHAALEAARAIPGLPVEVHTVGVRGGIRVDAPGAPAKGLRVLG